MATVGNWLEQHWSPPTPNPNPPAAAPAAKVLAMRIKGTSLLGDYATPVSALRRLLSVQPCARALTSIREWLPNLQDVTGRGIEVGFRV